MSSSLSTSRGQRHKRRLTEANQGDSNLNNGDAGRPAVRSKTGLESSGKTRMRERQEELKIEKKEAYKTRRDKKKPPPRNPIPLSSRYSNLLKPKIQELLEPFGVPGVGTMRKGELVQLCLLYEPEIPNEPSDAISTAEELGGENVVGGSSIINLNDLPELDRSQPSPIAEKSHRGSVTNGKRSQKGKKGVSKEDQVTKENGSDLQKTQPDDRLEKSLEDDGLEDPTYRFLLDALEDETNNKHNQEKGKSINPRKNHRHDPLGKNSSEGNRRQINSGSPSEAVVGDTNNRISSKNKHPVTSTPILYPSRERGTALRRPPPTILSAVAKGKQRQQSEDSDVEWVPNSARSDRSSDTTNDSEIARIGDMIDPDEIDDLPMDFLPSTIQHARQPSNDSNFINNENDLDEEQDSTDDDGSRAAIAQMLLKKTFATAPAGNINNLTPRTSQANITPDSTSGRNNDNRSTNEAHQVHNDADFRELTRTVQNLGLIVSNLVSGATPSTGLKSGGGKQSSIFLSRIRKHVWTLMGLEENADVPPGPSLGQKSTWKIWAKKKDMLNFIQINNFEPDDHALAPGVDPCFPYKGGPGGRYSNPQTLLIMWTMMKQYGVSSFRPIWEEGMSSEHNGFLWNLAAAIFIHLVKCGEYDDITTKEVKFEVVLTALKKHGRQSLKRRFREANEWSVTRIQTNKRKLVRGARLKNLKERRIKISGSIGLWELCPIVKECCSDDESGTEKDADGQDEKIFKVKKMPWRSGALESVILKLEDYAARRKKDSPKGTRGVAPVRRIRNEIVSPSHTEAPRGLPIDCYDDEWLNSLQARDPQLYEALEVNQNARLANFDQQISEHLEKYQDQ